MPDTRAANPTAPAPYINVTPFIDILLVLLIIFMVVTPLRPHRFTTHTPAPPADDTKIKMSPRTLVVSLEEGSRLTLRRGGNVVAEATLDDASAIAARLAEEWRERKMRGEWKEEMIARAELSPDLRIERTVFIKAPRSSSYGEVARVVDAVTGAGAQPVGLQTDELPN